MHDRRAAIGLALAGASALALSACSNIIGPPDAPDIYMLRPAFTPATPPSKAPWTLAVQRPAAPDALDGNRIAILKADGTIDYYAKAQYQDTLESLVETAIVDGFAKSGAVTGVARASESLQSDYQLLVDITDFQARYAVPDGVPDAMVTLSVKLVTTRGRHIAGTLVAAKSVPASQNSIPAATQALQQALTASITAVVGWAAAFPAPPPPSDGTR